MGDKELRKNGCGYSDPTAYEAITNIEKHDVVHKLIYAIFNICDLAGFRVEGRIVLIDKNTGRIWK